MLILPSEKTSPTIQGRDQSNISTNETTGNDGQSEVECDTEISIDLSRMPVENPAKTKKNITIKITSLKDHSTPSNAEEPKETALSPISRDKLIRLKIKIPKSPKTSGEIKRDRSFFTEKDFSTLPKEFIKFANSMICGDDPRKDGSRGNSEAKKRYCNKNLHEERRANCDVEKEFGTISPIEHEPIVSIPSSTPKDMEETVAEPVQDRKKLEPLYFTKVHTTGNDAAETKEINSEFNGVKICDVVEKKPSDAGFKPYEDIIAKLKPYSKYRMQYLHNLRRLQSKECIKHTNQDFLLPVKDENPAGIIHVYDQNELDENDLIQLVNQSTKYHPVMGKNALLSKMFRKHQNDSEIVRELVTEKFSPFFERRRRERRDINNYSLPIDSIGYDKDEKLQKINNNLNQTVHRIVVNEEMYAVINKNNKLKELDFKPADENEIMANSKTKENNFGHQEIEHLKPNEFSSYSDYDVEKFLQNAIGDVSLLSQAMDTSHRSKRLDHFSEDHSIATGEMSVLVSKASSISTFCSTIWRRITRRNSGIAPQESDVVNENEERLRKEERNKRVTLLKQEASVQNEIIRQASKALDYCERLPGVDFLSQRVEAERVILIATHKNKMIQHEIEDVTYYSTIRSACSYLGSFTLRNLQFKVKDVCKKQDECSQWFVCIVNRGTETTASMAVQASDDGSVAFKEEFSFEYLPPDFEIGISVFTLKVKKHKQKCTYHLGLPSNGRTSEDSRSSFQRMKFFSFRRDPKPAFGKKTLTSRFSRTSLRSPNKDYALPVPPIRQTSFLFLGETTVTIKDVSKTTLILTNIANFANIFEPFTALMTGSVNIDESFSDFLNIGTESGEKIMWTRRWCTLQNVHFNYWNSPSDEEADLPLKTVDLAYAIKDVVSADRSICPRARTLQLEVQKISPEEEGFAIERYFLTSDTTESMHNWEKSLNSIISTLRAWNCLKSIDCQ